MKNNRRLFITTGLVSVLNAMAIIDSNDGYDNFLYIAGRVQNEDFRRYNREIILPGYFKEVFFDADREKYETHDFLKQFAVVYMNAQPKWNFHLYHDNIFLIEEGISSYCHFPNSGTPSVKGAILRNYLDHIFYMKKDFPVIKQNREKLKNIIKKVARVTGLSLDSFIREKQVLMLAQYIYSRIFPADFVTAFYKKHISFLADLGYNIVFKTHPRINEDTFTGLKNYFGDKIIFLPSEINYPCEIIAIYFNFLLTASSMSGAGISLADLYGIPAFGFGANIIGEYPLNNYVNFYKRFYLNYIPHISAIKDIRANNPDCSTLLKDSFLSFLNNARDWRTDENIIAAHKKYIGEL